MFVLMAFRKSVGLFRITLQVPSDLALVFREKLTNQKYSNAQLCSEMFHNDKVCNQFISLKESYIRKHYRTGHSMKVDA